MTHSPFRLRLPRRIATLLSCAASAALWSAVAFAAGPATKTYDIPSGDAAATLKQFTAQSDAQVVYLVDAVRGVQTNAVQGEYTAREALDHMLAGTVLVAMQDDRTGALTVSRHSDPNAPRATLPATASVRPATPATSPADDQVIRLSPFHVGTTQDVGYLAANSVSATRINTPIKDLPFAVSAFTSQFITDIDARDLFDIVQYAPGVTSSGREFNAGNAMYTIRGYDQSPERNGFAGNAYVDTVDIDRVEVVKGPASVLYGQVAPGGVVNYITKTPAAKPSATLNLQTGSYGFFRTQVDVNQPLVAGTVLFRLNGAWENGLQYIDPSQSRTTVVDPAFTWKLNERVSLTVDYEWFKRNETPEAQFLPNMEVATAASMNSHPLNPKAALSSSLDSSDPGFLGYYPLPRTFNYASRNDWRRSDFETLDAELEVRLSDRWNARADVQWNQNDDRQKLTGLGTIYISAPPGYTDASFAAAVLADPNAALLSTHAYLPRRKRLQEVFSHGTVAQVEIAGNTTFPWGKLRPLAGAYFNESIGWNRLQQDAVSDYFPAWDLTNPATIDHTTDFDPTAYPITTYTRATTHNEAAYGVLNGSFLDDRLFFVGGARYNYADSQTNNYVNNSAGDKFRANRTTPQAGLGYKVTRDVMLYGSYSESFVQNAAFLTINNQPAGPAKPTTSRGYEVGVKTDLQNGRISSTVSVYQIDQKDRIVRFNSFFNGSTVTNNIQGTVDRSKGLEAELTYSPVDNWQIYGSVADDDIRTIQVPAGYGYYLGSHPEATVRLLGNVWSRFTVPGGTLKGLWLGGGFNYVGEKAQRVNNRQLFLPAYTLVNSAVGYDWTWGGARMTAVLNWYNMSNVEYFPANQQRGMPGRVVLSVTARF